MILTGSESAKDFKKESDMNYVCGFMFSEDRAHVALIEKQKPDFLKGMWNGIGGRIDSYEPAEFAMAREFEEETGVHTTVTEWNKFCHLTIGPDPVNGEDNSVIFYAAFSSKVNNVKTMESESVRRVHIEYAVKYMKLVNNLSWLIPMALDEQVVMADVKGAM